MLIFRSLFSLSQEKADTLLILLAVRVAHQAELVISSPDTDDTDVLLLLVCMYSHFPVSTFYITGIVRLKRDISVSSIIYNNLGQKRSSAPLLFHALTGSDMSG